MSRSVALAGLMGAGKSTVGRLLAGRLGVDFVDLDRELEGEAGCEVAAIFAREGEPGFRRREAAVLQRVLDERRPMVLALGGGTVHQAGLAEVVAAAMPVVVLRAPLAILLERVGDGSSRPLGARLAALAAARAPLLEQLGPSFSTHDQSPSQVAEAIAQWLARTDD